MNNDKQSQSISENVKSEIGLDSLQIREKRPKYEKDLVRTIKEATRTKFKEIVTNLDSVKNIFRIFVEINDLIDGLDWESYNENYEDIENIQSMFDNLNKISITINNFDTKSYFDLKKAYSELREKCNKNNLTNSIVEYQKYEKIDPFLKNIHAKLEQ